MDILEKGNFKICIVGLGYVGLPLASRFVLKGFNIVGFDINKTRVEQLQNAVDMNIDVSKDNLEILAKNAKLTSEPADIKDCNIFIITVPTPINIDKTPDLNPIISASKLVGSQMKANSIVIYESTVYPGVTDDICSPILEETSNLKLNIDFSTGYSPERIVPGDKVNTIETIQKVVSGSNTKSLEVIEFLYSSIIDAGVHKAPSIKVAEAAKVTENIQRDVNIALINELHQLYTSLDINTNDVIDAASTKWNFMKLTPGLVGGHCISIDPYYLMHKSKMTGYAPNIMQASRKLNEGMSKWVIEDFIKFTNSMNINLEEIQITILGYTFKENCSDTRNTKVKDLINALKEMNFNIKLWDPMLSSEDKRQLHESGISVYENEPTTIELAFVCVYHDRILNFLKNNHKGLIYDYRKKL